MPHSRRSILWCWMVFLGCTACAPHTVATTAQPVPKGKTAPALIWYSTATGIESLRDSTNVAWLAIDAETRIGVSDRADFGIRVVAGSGLVANYKYRLTANPDPQAGAVAIMGGGGLVNFGNHAHFEATFIASGRQAKLTPYGGLRATQVLPLSRDGPSDSPTAGGFLGVRFGKEQLGVSAEVGVFYHRSRSGARPSNMIVVPALVLHGQELIRAIRDATGGGPRPQR